MICKHCEGTNYVKAHSTVRCRICGGLLGSHVEPAQRVCKECSAYTGLCEICGHTVYDISNKTHGYIFSRGHIRRFILNSNKVISIK